MDKIAQVIMVDDDPTYIDLVRRALLICQPRCHLTAFSDGTELLDWLAINQRPTLILLDIQMPTSSGFEVLEVLKSNESYKPIPVIMLSISDRKRDVVQSYYSGANGYIEKPERFTDLLSCLKLTTTFWLSLGNTPDTGWTNAKGFNLN